MDVKKSAALLSVGAMLCGCDGNLSGFLSSSNQSAFTEPGYYGSPAYIAEPYQQPVVPYGHQPDYGAAYGYQPGWSERHDGREQEWRARRNRTFQMRIATLLTAIRKAPTPLGLGLLGPNDQVR